MAENKKSYPTKAVIGGRSVDATGRKTFETVNPSTGKVLAEISECTAADVDKAVAAARQAFDEGPWPRMSPAERKGTLQRFATVIEANAEELAELEALEGASRSPMRWASTCPRRSPRFAGMLKRSTRSATRSRRPIPAYFPWWCASPSAWWRRSCHGTFPS